MSVVIRWARELRWWVLDYAYALHWQVRAIFSRIRPGTFLGGDGTPVVFVPGVYETWRFLQPLIERVNRSGHPVHVLDFAKWNSGPVIRTAEDVIVYLESHDLRNVTIVAHSKGGLVGKYVMAAAAGRDRVSGMLAVASPFSGSRYARYLVLPGLRMFSPRDQTILALARQDDVNARIVSMYGCFDPHIPGGSELPGAKNIELDAGGHFRVLAHPRVFAELTVVLTADGQAPS